MTYNELTRNCIISGIVWFEELYRNYSDIIWKNTWLKTAKENFKRKIIGGDYLPDTKVFYMLKQIK